MTFLRTKRTLSVRRSEPDVLTEGQRVLDLISEGQEVVVDPQAVDRSHEQLCDVVRVGLRSVPGYTRGLGFTLVENLEKSIEPRTLDCKRRNEKARTNDLQSRPSLPNPLHPFGPVNLSAKTGKFNPTTVEMW